MSLAAFARAFARAAILAFAVAFAGAANAVPSFAVQTGRPCSACHIGGLGPQLTPFGREFKMHGYTARAVGFNVPLAAFAVASYVRTLKDQESAPAPSSTVNDNFALDQVSLFLAGGLGHHLGAFVQNTYNGITRAFTWDNLDVRAVTTAKAGAADLVLGLDLNNNPTVQDGFNTLYAWSFPYTTSQLAPTPGTAPLIEGLAQETLGVSGYVWIDSRIYAEVGGYRSPGAGFLRRAGSDPLNPGKIAGVAPYGRIAFQKNFGDRNFEIGAFALAANVFPGRDETTGLADHFTDLGADASWQYFSPHRDVFTINGRYTYERRNPEASRALGLAARDGGDLQQVRIDTSWYWRDKVGASVQVFDLWGSPDELLYAGNRRLRPDSSGVVLQLDGTPYGDGGSPLGARFNVRVGVQYTAYFTFDGAATNYDALGRNASDNNTFRVFTWIYY
ncbi:MAG: hypothetical protein ABI376_04740 [Caulobacteraceae bacterium]